MKPFDRILLAIIAGALGGGLYSVTKSLGEIAAAMSRIH